MPENFLNNEAISVMMMDAEVYLQTNHQSRQTQKTKKNASCITKRNIRWVKQGSVNLSHRTDRASHVSEC